MRTCSDWEPTLKPQKNNIMLRFIQHNLTTIGNVEYFPIISLVLFSLFFILVVIRVFKMSKSSVDELSQIPLNDKTEEFTKN